MHVTLQELQEVQCPNSQSTFLATREASHFIDSAGQRSPNAPAYNLQLWKAAGVTAKRTSPKVRNCMRAQWVEISECCKDAIRADGSPQHIKAAE